LSSDLPSPVFLEIFPSACKNASSSSAILFTSSLFSSLFLCNS